jgi:hypothetical protein
VEFLISYPKSFENIKDKVENSENAKKTILHSLRKAITLFIKDPAQRLR